MNIYKIALTLVFFVLIGCDHTLSNRDRERIDNLNKSIGLLNEKLDRFGDAPSEMLPVGDRDPFLGEAKFDTEIDHALHDLTIGKGIRYLGITPLGKGKYQVDAWMQDHYTRAMREIALPSNVVAKARANAGYQIDVMRLINQKERDYEKELVIEAVRSMFRKDS